MAVGKYSPTVSGWYQKKKDWFQLAEGSPLYDKDGFDLYGYNAEGLDRAGNHENEYMVGEYLGEEYVYPLYETVYQDWRNKPLPY